MTVRVLFDVDEATAITTALLHDVIEDTTAYYDDLAREFGVEVADWVAALTKDSRLPEAEREHAYDRQLSAADWRLKLIKLADVYDNFCDAPDAASRAEAGQKAARAIRVAGSDPRLAKAVEIVSGLLNGPAQGQ